MAIVLTDGDCCTIASLKAAGDSLRALGVTVVGVGIGLGTVQNTDAVLDNLEALASVGMDGTPLVFSGAEFDEIEDLLVNALFDIGVPLACIMCLFSFHNSCCSI